MNLFEFESVSVAYEGRPVLENFSLAISEGDKVIFRGPSGSGKSTLVRLLLGFVRPDSGEVRFRGEPLTPEIAWSLRKEIAYVNQSPGFETGTTAQAIQEILHLKAGPGDPGDASIGAALAAFDLDASVLRQPIGELSGGERQRIGLAASLLLNRSIFFLDEPTAALDAGLKQKVADLYLENRTGWTVVAAAHDEAWFADRDGLKTIDLTP